MEEVNWMLCKHLLYLNGWVGGTNHCPHSGNRIYAEADWTLCKDLAIPATRPTGTAHAPARG